VSSAYMVPLAKALSTDCAVYVPDLPGFGRSSKPSRILDESGLADALLAWMDALTLDRAVMLGHSFGCQILADAAMRHPSRLRGAIFASPTVEASARTARHQFWRLLLDVPRERLSLPFTAAAAYAQAGIPRFVGTFRVAVADRVEEKLPHVTAPAIVIRGSRDPLVSQEWAEQFASALPSARLVVVPGAAHAVIHSHPRQVATLVCELTADS
jgi:2-hydroxy-6-oxonona-2,4-dienedioate hydrolase